VIHCVSFFCHASERPVEAVEEVEMTEDEMLAQALALSMEDVPSDEAPAVPVAASSQPVSAEAAEVIQLPAAEVAAEVAPDVVMSEVPVPAPGPSGSNVAVPAPGPSGSSSSMSRESDIRATAFWDTYSRDEAGSSADVDMELARALALSMSESHGIDDRAVETALSFREAGRWSCEICTYSNPDISEV
jgi:hypothetical protein